MALAAVRTSGDLCGKSARPYGRGCRVASGNKGKSVVIQLFPRDETGMVVGNSDSEGEQRKTTLRALSLSISGRAILEEQEGRRAIRIDASFCLNYYLPPFFFSLFLSLHPLSLHPLLFFLPPLLLFSQTSSPPRSYTIFLNSRESSSVLAIYARNFTTSSLNSRWRDLSLS